MKMHSFCFFTDNHADLSSFKSQDRAVELVLFGRDMAHCYETLDYLMTTFNSQVVYDAS